MYNVTNAFLNSLWLLDRLGMMATRGTPLMARQSLIGYNYSLLGNFPDEPIFAAPDFYSTVLFKRLAGTKVLPMHGAAKRAWAADDSAKRKLRAYAYCSATGAGAAAGAVTLVLVNTDDAVAVTTSVAGLGGGAVEVYALTPGWDARDLSSPPLYRATSRHLALNGRVLAVDERGALPPMPPELQPPPATGQPTRLTLPPLTAMFAVFREAGAGACMQE